MSIGDIQDVAGKVARKLAQVQDEVITEAINRRIGHHKWEINYMVQRLEREIHLGADREVAFELWKLDGIDMLKIFPLSHEAINEGNESRLVLKFNHQYLP